MPRRPGDRLADPIMRREVRGDIDLIVMKALAKDPEERYRTARDLADDIRRHLSSHPIIARRPSAAYRTRRFVSRHRVGVAAAGGRLVTATAGARGVLWLAGGAAGARNRGASRV